MNNKIDVLVEIAPNHRIAMQDLKQFTKYVYENYDYECNLRAFKQNGYVEIGRYRLYFIGEEEYSKWCRGRKYLDKDGNLMHSGHRVDSE